MPQDPSAILGELKKGTFKPVYFLQGEESFYIDQISDYIEENALEEAQKGFNQVILYGKDVDVNGVLSNAKRFPMMSERQVVIVKEAQEIRDLGKEDSAKWLLEYIKAPLTSTVLVFCHKNKALDGRKALGKAMDKNAVLVTTKKMYDNQIPDWITSHVKDNGYGIHPKAVVLLSESVGANLANLSNEITKVMINVPKGTEINEDHITKFVGVSKDYNVFELQKALATKNVLKANQIIAYFAKDPRKNPIIPIIALLFSYFSKILVMHHTKDKSDKNLASILKVNPYFLKDYKQAAGNYSLVGAIQIIKYIQEADLQSKGVGVGNMDQATILKELVFKIVHS